jgi:DNA-directed RNA polymerases I, II, and III subunit RPABC2
MENIVVSNKETKQKINKVKNKNFEKYDEVKEIEKNDKTIELFGEVDNYNEHGIILSDDDDDDIINIEDNIEYNLLNKFHPEIKQINNNELNSLIIQDKNKKGYDSNHTTLPIMTRYEKAKIIGIRASQINAGSEILIDIPDNIIDGITIAKMELEQKKIPFIIRRPLPNGKSEYWDINDLEILE